MTGVKVVTAAGRPHVLTRLIDYQRYAPGQVAIRDHTGETTYGQLWAAAAATAESLRAAGVRRGDVVAIMTGRGAAFVAGCVATWLAGAMYLPLDVGMPRYRLRGIVAEAQPAAAIVSGHTAGTGAGLELLEVPVQPGGHGGGLPQVTVTGADPAYLTYTSGTSGRPKGVVITHGSLDNFARWFIAEFGVGPDDRMLHAASLGFDAAIMELWPALAAGAAIAVCPDEDRLIAEDIAFQLADLRCSIAFVVTPLAEEMLAAGVVPSGLRYLITGGDLLRITGVPPVGCTLVNGYGPTEATVLSTSHRVADFTIGTAPPIGRAISGASLVLCDESLSIMPEGQPGEILIGGKGVAAGYYLRPELTAERFVTLPGHDGIWYRTGDLAVARRGELTFAGRLDREQLEVRGVRVEADDIEAALLSIPAVRAAAVTTIGKGADCQLIALLVAPADLPVRQIRAHLSERLPGSLVPNRLTFVDRVPLTVNGKIDRARIAEFAEQQFG